MKYKYRIVKHGLSLYYPFSPEKHKRFLFISYWWPIVGIDCSTQENAMKIIEEDKKPKDKHIAKIIWEGN